MDTSIPIDRVARVGTETAPLSAARVWTGRVLTALTVLFMLFDSIGKLVMPIQVVQASARLGFPMSLSQPVGVILLIATLAYAGAADRGTWRSAADGIPGRRGGDTDACGQPSIREHLSRIVRDRCVGRNLSSRRSDRKVDAFGEQTLTRKRQDVILATNTLPIQSALLKLPGAQIYYEVQGAGPVLLMIPGGPTDAGIFCGIAPHLADRYTVVRYDPRGNSRSQVEGAPRDQDMNRHGDDSAALLAAMTNEPAFVLGCSGGAQIGLNLVARHPGRVKTLVAHEPPCLRLLPSDAEEENFRNVVQETYRTAGAGAAMKKFAEGAGLSRRSGERKSPPSPELAEAFARTKANAEFFILHGMKPIGSYLPDVATLRASATRVVMGVGAASTGTLPYRSAVALAERLGVEPVAFPGGHGGYNDDPAGFAAKLDAVLQESSK